MEPPWSVFNNLLFDIFNIYYPILFL